MPGWIKLYRKLLDSDMYKSLTSKQRDVLIAVLLMVNFEKKKWEWGGEVFECNPGQCITSLDSILKKCAKEMKVQSVRTALLKLERWGFLTNVSTKTGRLITILNWSEYQSDNYDINKAANKELTKRQQSSNKELTPSKKYKEVKESKEEEIKEGENDDRTGNDNLVPLSYLNGDGYSQHMQNHSEEDGKGDNPFPVVNGSDGDNGVKPASEANLNGGLLDGQDTANARADLDVPRPSLNDNIHTGDNRGSDGDSISRDGVDGQAPVGEGGAQLDREVVGHDGQTGLLHLRHGEGDNDSRDVDGNGSGNNNLPDNKRIGHGMVELGDDRRVDLVDHGGVSLSDKGELNHDLLGAKKEDEAKPPAQSKKKKSPIPYREIVDHFNRITGKSYRHTSKQTMALIRARWSEGFVVDDFVRVISHINQKWKGDPKMSQYLRPHTLFNGKFESYLQDAPVESPIGITKDKKKELERLKARYGDPEKPIITQAHDNRATPGRVF